MNQVQIRLHVCSVVSTLNDDHHKFQHFFFLDVDECVELEGVCTNQGECENTFGSYKCVCSHGYRGNGTHCTGKMYTSVFFFFLLALIFLSIHPSIHLPIIQIQYRFHTYTNILNYIFLDNIFYFATTVNYRC